MVGIESMLGFVEYFACFDCFGVDLVVVMKNFEGSVVVALVAGVFQRVDFRSQQIGMKLALRILLNLAYFLLLEHHESLQPGRQGP